MTIPQLDTLIASEISSAMPAVKLSVGSIVSPTLESDLGPVRRRLIFVTVSSKLSVALLSSEYETDRGQLTYIQKLDTTTNRLPGLARTLVRSYISHRGGRIHLFARSMDVYLFPHSNAKDMAETHAKNVRPGSDLVKWWRSTLDMPECSRKHVLVPGELKARYCQDGWTWGLDSADTKTLPLFEDDPKSKCVALMNGTDMEELYGMLEIVPEFSTVGGLFSVECGLSEETKDATSTSESNEGFDEFLALWMRQSFTPENLAATTESLLAKWKETADRNTVDVVGKGYLQRQEGGSGRCCGW
jgi:Histone acetylation protein